MFFQRPLSARSTALQNFRSPLVESLCLIFADFLIPEVTPPGTLFNITATYFCEILFYQIINLGRLP
jgi:hypothetical protein